MTVRVGGVIVPGEGRGSDRVLGRRAMEDIGDDCCREMARGVGMGATCASCAAALVIGLALALLLGML